MVCSRWSRAAALLATVWFALVTLEPALMHACPAHGGASAREPLAAHGSAHAVHPGDAADHASNAASDHSRGHRAPHERMPAGPCACLAHCCAATPAAPIAATEWFVAAPVLAMRDGGLPADAYVPVAAEHVLPFQNGPPTRI